MDLFGSHRDRESDCIGWSSSNPSYNEEYDDWLLPPSQSSTSTSTTFGSEDLRTILTMDHPPEWPVLEGPGPLVRDQDEDWVSSLQPIQAQAQAPRRLISDASWDAVRHRRAEKRHNLSSSSNALAGTSSGPWRPWDDRPATTQHVPSTSAPPTSINSTTTPSLYIPPDHKIAPPNSSEQPKKSNVLELLNSMNERCLALPSKGNGKGGAQEEEADEEEEDPTSLSTFTCPVCFSPPENATLTPCGHVMCTFSLFSLSTAHTERSGNVGGKCLFSAIKAARQRHAGLYGREGLAPDGTKNEAICPVCRVPIPGWDGKGGGVIGLSMMVEEG